MFNPAPELLKHAAATVFLPESEQEGVVDHPSTWLELLEALPTAAPDGTYVSSSADLPGPSGFAAICKTSDPIIDATGMQGTRHFDIEVSDEHIKYQASLNLHVKATADHLAVSLGLVSVEDGLLHEPVYATWLSVAITALSEQVCEAVAQMHARLASDLAETTCELTLIMPNEKFGPILSLSLKELKGWESSSVQSCGMRYASAFADAVVAPAPVRQAKESARITLSTEQRLALALNLGSLREARGFSQLEVAFQALGFSKSHAAVSRLERGILNEVENDRLKKLAAFYDTSADALLGNKIVSSAPSDVVAPEVKGSKSIFDPECDLAPASHFGNRLTLARTSAGLSQAALARKLGHAADTTVKAWEEEVATPRRVTFIDLATALDVPVSWLMFGRRTETPARAIGLRLTAMQKLYNLSNSELAALMENTEDISTIETTGKLLSRLSRNRSQPAPEVLARLSHVLQVPADWIAPPGAEVLASRATMEAARHSINDALNEQGNQLQGLSKGALKLVNDLIELIQMGVIETKDFRTLREDLIAKYTTPYIRGQKATSAAVAV